MFLNPIDIFWEVNKFNHYIMKKTGVSFSIVDDDFTYYDISKETYQQVSEYFKPLKDILVQRAYAYEKCSI